MGCCLSLLMDSYVTPQVSNAGRRNAGLKVADHSTSASAASTRPPPPHCPGQACIIAVFLHESPPPTHGKEALYPVPRLPDIRGRQLAHGRSARRIAGDGADRQSRRG